MKIIFFKKMLLLTALLICVNSGFGQGELVVTKPAKAGNPKLSIQFDGDNNTIDLLKTNLYYSDWFELVDSQEADYYLSGELKSDSDTIVVHIEIKDSNGTSVAKFDLETQADTSLKTLTNEVVDEIIAQIFNAPGFCSSNIAFVKELNGEKEVWVADFNGDNPRQLTYDRNISVEPDWSRANEYLAYTFYNNSSIDIILIDMINQRRKRLAQFPGLNSGAAFANNSNQIAMTLSKDRNVDLYVLELAEDRFRRVTATAGAEASPCWSPNDSHICYVSDEGGTRPTLFLIPSAGGTSNRLLTLPVEAVSPDWSPISNKICFSLRSKGQYTIAVVDMNSKVRKPEVLISAEGDWEAPSWAPDGRHIVCTRSLNDKKGLHLVDTYFKKIIPLKTFSGKDSLPCYSDVTK